jgi:tetratricopeptide (TPR) repeat protein
METPASSAGQVPPDSALDRLRGALAERYAIERELGRGGMAVVFLALDRRHGRPVALKVIKPGLASMVGTERFHREIRIAAGLQHPHIVPVHDSGDADGALYYVMPYVEGESLRTRLQREGRLRLDHALAIACEVAAALGYAHDRGVLHRDIKPENILLSGGRALVLDFGIARPLGVSGGDSATYERLTETGLALGTPAYMSPEQSTASARLDQRTDVYSLGCVLYEMLTGETPYTGPSAQAIIAKRIMEPIPRVRTLRDSVPAAVEQAVTRALAKDPADRFETAAEFAAALAPGTVATAHAGAPTAVTIPLDGPGRRRPKLITAAALGSVAVAAAVAAVLALRPSSAKAPLAAAERRVLVSAFENRTGEAANDPIGRMAADWVSHGLVQTGLVDVVRPPPGTDAATVEPKNTAAAMVVSGAYYRVGDSLELHAQVADADSARVLRTVGPIWMAAARPVEGIEQLRERLMGALAVLVDPHFSEWTRRTPVVPTYAAYREFVEGVDLYQKAEWEPAIAHLRRATALDSSFTLARLWLAEAHLNAATNLDPKWAAPVDSLLSLPADIRARLPPLDRAVLDHRVAQRTGDLAGALDGARRAATLWPDRYANSAALYALLSRRPKEAVPWLERVDGERGYTSGWWEYWLKLATAWHWLGDHRKELGVARRARQRLPDNPRMIWFQAQAILGLGQVGPAVQLFDSAATAALSHGDVFDAVEATIHAVGELHAHGLPSEARELAEHVFDGARTRLALPSAEHLSPPTASEFKHVMLGLAYAAERWNQARATAESLLVTDPKDLRALTILASLAARNGDRDESKRLIGILRGRTTRGGPTIYVPRRVGTEMGESWLAGARVAALLGEPEEAVRLLNLVAQQYPELLFIRFLLHQDMDFASLHDYPPFVAFLAREG